MLVITAVGPLASADDEPVDHDRGPHWSDHGDYHRHGDRHPGYHGPRRPSYRHHWYQRPYPYHLDFYRREYGGSYAPYFGNLYGPPQHNYYGPYTPQFGPGLGFPHRQRGRAYYYW